MSVLSLKAQSGFYVAKNDLSLDPIDSKTYYETLKTATKSYVDVFKNYIAADSVMLFYPNSDIDDEMYLLLIKDALSTGKIINNDKNLSNLLIKASGRGFFKTVSYLININKSIVNNKNSYGWTPLYKATICIYNKATENDLVKVVKTLINAGAEVDLQENNHGQTALMQAAVRGKTKVLQTLLTAGADIDKQDKDGNTALMQAASSRETNTVQFLLTKGADINKKDNKGRTALKKAVGNCHGKTAKVLIKALKISNLYEIEDLISEVIKNNDFQSLIGLIEAIIDIHKENNEISHLKIGSFVIPKTILKELIAIYYLIKYEIIAKDSLTPILLIMLSFALKFDTAAAIKKGLNIMLPIMIFEYLLYKYLYIRPDQLLILLAEIKDRVINTINAPRRT